MTTTRPRPDDQGVDDQGVDDPATALPGVPRRPFLRRPLVLVVAAVVVVAAIVAVVFATVPHAPTAPAQRPAAVAPTAVASQPAPAPATPVPAPPAIDAAAIAALPDARYDAVIAGLVPFDKMVATSTTATVFHLTADAPLYNDDRTTAVGRLPQDDFLGQPTIVVGVQAEGAWELVLTPARQALPSSEPAGTTAPAQTAAWVPAAMLTTVSTPTSRVVIDTAKQTVSIVDASGTTLQSFPAGIGTPNTPTPTNVTGYLEERYVDPAQGTGNQPIQLTSLHSAAADEPYGGSDGGLIGVHYYSAHSGAVSHGCVRLDTTAIEAIDALPLGTLVTVQ